MKIFSFIRRQMTLLVVLCCFVFFGSQAAQAQVSSKTDPGTNNPPPAGAILDLSGTPIPGGGNGTYQHYSVNFTATLTSTAITLAFRDDPAQVSVANVSVVDLANPSVNLLVNGDFSQGPVGSNTPTGWTYANIFGVFAGGSVVSGSRFCYTAAFCWLDGAVLGFDAISQNIATTIGDTYQISFDVAEDSAIFATPGSHGGLFPATYPGSDCYLAAHGGPSPCKFSNISINGDTTDPAGNGIDVTAYAQGGLPPPGSATQMQDTPPINFNPTQDTTISVTFNNTPSQVVRADVILPATSDLTFPTVGGTPIDPATVQFQETNRFVSNADPFTGGTAFATAKPFDHAGNDAMASSTGNGAKYEVLCFDRTHTTPSEANCPFPSPSPAGTPPKHIRHEDLFDLGGTQPTIVPGTTVEMIHWNLHPDSIEPSWSATSTIPHPACTNMTMPGTPTFKCDLEGILVNKFGKANGFGSDTKKGDYLLVYNVPMPCSAWKVNGVRVNTPCVQGPSVFFVRSPLNFVFDVTPAQCPASQTCVNGWTAAPVNNLFWTFDPLNSAPDLPGMLIDLTDTFYCPGPGMNTHCPVPNGVYCPGANCAVTNDSTPGASSSATVEFTSPPPPAPGPATPDGQYLLQVSAADTVKIKERNVQLLTDPLAQCPNPFLNVEPTATPPCYSTKLFSAQINVDNTLPTVTGLTLSPTTQIPGQSITANYSCSDTVSGGVASGIAFCGPGLQIPSCGAGSQAFTPGTLNTGPLSNAFTVQTGLNGPQTCSVTATDRAGNSFTANANYFAGYQFFGFFAPVSNPGTGGQPVINVIKAGRTVPVMWQVLDGNGVGVTGLILGSSNGGVPSGTVHLAAVNSTVCARDTVDNNILVDSSGNSGLQDLGGGNYQFNWKTVLPSGACVLLTVDPGDGTQHPAYFQAK